MERKQLVLTACYLSLVAILLHLLFEARTPVARTIWATFDPSNLIVYLGMTFVLLVIIISKGRLQAKLGLIIIHSVVSNVFKVIVFASRFGYDTWISLGWSTYIYRGELYSLSNIPFMVYSNLPLLSKMYHVTERVNLYSLSVILARMFSVDVYWTHLLLVPLLWGIFIPVLTYKVTKFLFKGEDVPLLSALLSCVILGGTATISFSLAFVFFLLTIYLSLNYLRFKKGLPLLVIVAFASFLTHELIGVVSVSVIFLTFTLRLIGDIEHKNVQRALLFMGFVYVVLLIPLALLYFGRFINPQSVPQFSLEPIEGLTTYEAIFVGLFGEFADMRFSEVLVRGILPFLGIIGAVYMLLTADENSQNRKMGVFIFLCLIFVIIDYTILKLFMVNLPFGEERLWPFRDLLALPFAAIAIYATMSFLSHKFSMNERLSEKIVWRGFSSIGLKGIALMFIFVLSISSLATAAIYTTYPHYTEAWWTTAYELEAAWYIEENTPRNETYVVLCDVQARLAGYAVVGPANPRAYYYGPYESQFLKPLYQELVDNPSMGPILAVREKNDASIVYVIINTIRVEVKNADNTLSQMMDLPYSELFGVFGEDVYVFKVRPPRERVITGVGPSVFLYNNQTYLNTTATVDVVTYKASYVLSLKGLTSYNITYWPMHWSFDGIWPTPTTKQIDADNWINFTGRADVVYTVIWEANNLYQSVGWKDDSFKTDRWRVTFSVHWEQTPEISTDGDILTMTGDFKNGIREGCRITRDVPDISTDEYPYVIVRWRSTGTVAGVAVIYDDSQMQVLKPDVTWHYAQYSSEWKLSVVKLPAGKTIEAVRLALDDYPSWTDVDGVHSVYYDYIMITKAGTPQLPLG